ncbi:MAG: hypothetical protein K2M19_03385 [Muribaculaceae bacterium]|nr:hypothetical protein [Muribaculaceae bacterium]
MKLFKSAILVLSLISQFTMTAQKLETRDFKVTNELTARLKDTELIDENSGKRAALIKIYTPFTLETLGFDAGLYQILGKKQAGPGEIWLYVPERTQKISITHPKYSPVVLWFDGTEAESGKTYTISLNVEGRDVSLIASAANADISVDGVHQGKSPVYMHMPLGSHLVKAELGSLLYEGIVTVTPDGASQFELQMEDENKKYGDVEIEVAGGAELWFQDHREGVGSLRKHLPAGTYVITAKLPDHEDQTTAFTVEAGKVKTVTATAPIPHLGYLAVVTDPEHGVKVMQADSLIDLHQTLQLPVANYEFSFSKRGYYPQTRKYHIEKGTTLRDTIRLERIQYVKKTTGYVSVGAAVASKLSVGVALGGFIENVNIELGYNLGLGRSNDVDWYNRDDKLYEGSYNYRLDEMSAKAGYQLRFAERFSLTPRVGCALQRLSAPNSSDPGNGFTQMCATVGALFSYHPVPHFGIFLSPDYAIPVSTTGDIVPVFSQAGLTRGGFKASIGVIVSL